MVDPNDPEMYYKIADEKKLMDEKLAYAVLSIAASMIRVKDERYEGAEIGRKMRGEVKDEMIDDDTPVEELPPNCEQCGKRLPTEVGEYTFYYGSFAFCSDECRTDHRKGGAM